MNNSISFIFVTLIISSCSVGINYKYDIMPNERYDVSKIDSIYLKTNEDYNNKNGRILGTFKVGGNYIDSCNIRSLLDNVKLKIKTIGGNIILLKEINIPGEITNCYSIKGDFIYDSTFLPVSLNDTMVNVTIYRRNKKMYLQKVNIYLRDSLLGDLRNNERICLKLPENRKYELRINNNKKGYELETNAKNIYLRINRMGEDVKPLFMPTCNGIFLGIRVTYIMYFERVDRLTGYIERAYLRNYSKEDHKQPIFNL